jgi:preprotein translocase subunit SecG
MESFIAILHIFVALILIALVLLQDTKSGSVGGAFGGGGSSSILGATGAVTLAQKMTRWTAVVFALTSIGLSVFASRSQKSVMDSAVLTNVPAATASSAPSSTTSPAAPAAPADAAAAPAAPSSAPATTGH